MHLDVGGEHFGRHPGAPSRFSPHASITSLKHRLMVTRNLPERMVRASRRETCSPPWGISGWAWSSMMAQGVGRPPENGVVIVEPGEDALGIGAEERPRTEIAAQANEAVGVGQFRHESREHLGLAASGSLVELL